MKMGVAMLLASGLAAEGLRFQPDLVANVSLLLARFYTVNCLHIFRTDEVPHRDVEAIHSIWKTLARTESKISTGVYTFEGYIRRKLTRPKKVSCYKSLKVLSDDAETRKGYAKFSKKFTPKDVVWVLYTDTPSNSFFQDAHVVFDDIIIIAVVESVDVVTFHEVYRVNDEFPLKFFSLGNWTREKGLSISEGTIYGRRSDLEGVVLRTASVQNWPATYFKNGRWQGFLIDLWKELEVLVNCTSVDVEFFLAVKPLGTFFLFLPNGDTLRELSVRCSVTANLHLLTQEDYYHSRGENLVGIKLQNGSWSGLVGMALRGEIDVIVTEVVIDKERSHALDFFHPIIKSRFQIYTRHLGYGWQWASILKPFHLSVWLAALSWVFIGSLIWALLHRICVSQGLGSMDFEGLPPVNAFFFVAQTLCQQGSHFAPTSYCCRLLFFVSYAVSSVLIPAYSASLVSYLSQKEHLRTFDSLQEMVADGTYRLMVRENTAQHTFFAHSKNEFFKLAYEKLVKSVPTSMKKMSMRESMKALCHLDKYAFMGVEDIVEERMQHLVTLDCPVVHLTHPVSSVSITMAMAKHHPFWGLINYHLGKLLNCGVAERLRRAAFPPGDESSFREKDTDKEVGMRQVVSGFAFIGFFGVVSLLLLILEIQHKYHETQRNRRKRKKRGLQLQPEKLLLQYEMKAYKSRRTTTSLPSFFSK